MDENRGMALYAPCKIGDTLYAVVTYDDDEPPFIEMYEVGAVMYDGEKWYVASDDFTLWDEYGSDTALADEKEAIRKFLKLRKEYERRMEWHEPKR